MRTRGNVSRRWPRIGVPELVRALLFVMCVAGGVAFTTRLGSSPDPMAHGLRVANGLFAGSLVGLMVAAQIRPTRR